jgi:hypothetical protein
MNAASNNTTFLFTSESVGEGHPGKFMLRYYLTHLNFSMLVVFRRRKYGTQFQLYTIFKTFEFIQMLLSYLDDFVFQNLDDFVFLTDANERLAHKSIVSFQK